MGKLSIAMLLSPSCSCCLGASVPSGRRWIVPASRFGIRSEYDVPDEVFMALELEAGILAGRAGIVRYHPAFSEV